MTANKYKVMVIGHIALKTDTPHPNYNMTNFQYFQLFPDKV